MQTTTALIGGKGSNPKTVLYVGGRASPICMCASQKSDNEKSIHAAESKHDCT